MRLNLMSKYLAITPIEEKTKGGILLHDSDKEKPSRGKITHVGEGKEDHPTYIYSEDQEEIKDSFKRIDPEPTFKVGQEILFQKYGAFVLDVDGKEIHIIDKEDVIATLG